MASKLPGGDLMEEEDVALLQSWHVLNFIMFLANKISNTSALPINLVE